MSVTRSFSRRLRYAFGLVGFALLTGCGEWQLPFFAQPARLLAALPQSEPSVPAAAARTAEVLDTTTKEERAAAQRPAYNGGVLGRTIVSLGSPSEPGFWLKTPLVVVEQPGQVLNPSSGKSAAVTLIPIEGPASAGSRLSLAAMRLLELQLTALVEVEVRAAP